MSTNLFLIFWLLFPRWPQPRPRDRRPRHLPHQDRGAEQVQGSAVLPGGRRQHIVRRRLDRPPGRGDPADRGLRQGDPELRLRRPSRLRPGAGHLRLQPRPLQVLGKVHAVQVGGNKYDV